MNQATDPAVVAQFKEAFRLHPAGVALVAGRAPDGLVGLTLSSVASVSADPAVLSFSVTRTTGSAAGILAAPSFMVHFLAETQSDIANAFARTGAPRFTPEQGWSELPTGEPLLAGATAALRCTVRETLQVGPSVLVLADVLEVLEGQTASPLLYQDRRFLSGAKLEPVGE